MIPSTTRFYQARPPAIRDKISSQFKELQKNTDWFIKGSSKKHYSIAGINEYHLLQQIILNNPQRENFWVLDIGAAQAGFGKGLIEFINAKFGENNIKVHIISISAEPIYENSVTQEGICEHIQLNEFNAELLCEEFVNRGYMLDSALDLIVSRWCLVHLVDPLGCFFQAVSLLRADGGLFLFHGFPFDQTHADQILEHGEPALIGLMIELGLPFLFKFNHCSRALSDFVLQRNSACELKVPLTYHDEVPLVAKDYFCSSRVITQFKRSKPCIKFDEPHQKESQGMVFPEWSFGDRCRSKKNFIAADLYYGSKSLFNMFSQLELLPPTISVTRINQETRTFTTVKAEAYAGNFYLKKGGKCKAPNLKSIRYLKEDDLAASEKEKAKESFNLLSSLSRLLACSSQSATTTTSEAEQEASPAAGIDSRDNSGVSNRDSEIEETQGGYRI